MKAFADLYAALDASPSTHAKVAAMRDYFAQAAPADAAWAAYLLAGGKPRQTIPTAVLRAHACALAGLPEWLFDECYHAVGDLAETIALVLPLGNPSAPPRGLASWIEDRLLPLRGLSPQEQAVRVGAYWGELDTLGRFLLTKMIGGGFRVGVSKLLVQRALAVVAGVDAKRVAERMMGYTDAKTLPTAARFSALIAPQDSAERAGGQPYPFFLAHALDVAPELIDEILGSPDEWLIEWKYDGIRAQIVRREGRVWLWSRGEELVTDRYPEVAAAAQDLPDGTVLDGELLVWRHDRPAPFSELQRRIGRKAVSAKLLAELPVVFLAYDLLEAAGTDLRTCALADRRSRLELLLAGTSLKPSETVQGPSWPALDALRAQSRERGVEGFMLKQRTSRYGSGRTKADGLWWKWKIAPMTMDAVLIYAQRGHGRRASVFTDYTFAVWNRVPHDAAEAQHVIEAIARGDPPAAGGLQLVTVAKAYSGLTDAEFDAVHRIINATTINKFGPVRSVKPSLVFELGFEGIAASARHKCGIAVRFPRMLRIRYDKPLHEADALPALQAMARQPADRADVADNTLP
jgi:DNA ligase 1